MNTDLIPFRYYHFTLDPYSTHDLYCLHEIHKSFSSYHIYCHGNHIHVLLCFSIAISYKDLTALFPFLDVLKVHKVRDPKTVIKYFDVQSHF